MPKTSPLSHTSLFEPASPAEDKEEERIISTLRSQNFDEFFGQKDVKDALAIAIAATKKRKEALEHILLYGPPGLGKTTLAHLIGKELGVNIKVTSGPAIERSGDLAAILTNLSPHDVLFIDEIHRLNKIVEETLYPAMEDYALDIVVGKGPSARTLRLDLPPFTVIGATTKVGSISSPMRDRFGVVMRLSYYKEQEIEEILSRAANKLHITLTGTSRKSLAKKSRGTPRIALRLLKRVRDIAEIEGDGVVTEAILNRAFTLLSIDEIGLDLTDRKLMLSVIDSFQGGPVGLDTLAAILAEDISTLEDMVEPYLMQIGFLKRTPRGRAATKDAYKYFGRPLPKHLTE